MAGRVINCVICGQPFYVKSPRGKYCPNCRDAANKAVKVEADKRYRDALKAGVPNKKVASYDTPEQIQTCLNCKRKNCPGFCKAVS